MFFLLPSSTARPHDARDGQNIDAGGAGALQDPGAFLDRRPRGEHVINQHNALAADLLRTPHGKRAGDIASSRHGAALSLRWGAATADQTLGRDRETAAALGNGVGEHGRLVMAPGEEPRPMERHWHQKIGIGKQRAAGLPHPLRQGWGEMEAVAMFQGENQMPARLVIAHRGASAVENRRRRGASAAQPVVAEVEIKRITAASAAWRTEEGDAAPAARAERTGRRHGHAAEKTARWQQQIEKPGAKPAQARGRCKAHHHAIVPART